MFGVLTALFALILLILNRLARQERESYADIADDVRTTFSGNLRRRGSIGNFDFLLPVGLRTGIFASLVSNTTLQQPITKRPRGGSVKQ